MHNEEEWSVMREQDRQGVSIRQVAKERGVSWRTAKKYMQSTTPPHYKERLSKPTKLDPFKDYIKGRLEHFPLNARKLFEEIQEKGYDGKYTLVKEFVRPIKHDKSIAAELRFETKPGEQAQVDWFYFGPVEVDGQRKTLWGFSMVMCFCRGRFLKYTTDATTPTFIQCHSDAFRFFGGWPKTILYDNTSNVVVKRMLKSSDSIMNPLFEDFARYHGFIIRLCKPGKEGAKTKGKIERTGQFIRGNFFMGLDFTSIDDINGKAIGWCYKVNSQVHATTNAIPSERLKQEKLTPVDSRPPYQIIITEHRRVSNDCFISVRGNKYSVPWKHAGRDAKLLIKERKMDVEIGGEIVCTHEIVPGINRRVRNKDHFAGLYKEILHRNRDTHIRRIECHSTGNMPVLLKNAYDGNVQVQKRNLAEYDALAERRDDA
jgi:transposase